MVDVEFVSELPKSPRTSGFEDFRQALKKNPGVWAKFPGKPATITRIKKQEHPWEGFEGCIREYQPYVRYVGQ
jgi:hypothetical protein